MTDRQHQILRYIDMFWRVHWTSPTVREICEGIGLSSPSTVHVHLERMVQMGMLERHKVGRRVLYRTSDSVRLV